MMTEAVRWHWGDVAATGSSAGMRLRHEREDAELWVRDSRLLRGEGYAAASREARRALARVGAIVRLRQRGRYFVHASGVVDPHGRAFVLSGDSGAGKSTLAYALARAGWRVLGDDGIILDIAAAGAVARGWRDPLRVSVALAGVFPELGRYRLRSSAADASRVDARERVSVPVATTTVAPVAALVFVRRADRRLLAEMEPLAVLAALVRQSPWVILPDQWAGAHLAALRHLALSVPALRFDHTEDDLLDVAAYLGERAVRPAVAAR